MLAQPLSKLSGMLLTVVSRKCRYISKAAKLEKTGTFDVVALQAERKAEARSRNHALNDCIVQTIQPRPELLSFRLRNLPDSLHFWCCMLLCLGNIGVQFRV